MRARHDPAARPLLGALGTLIAMMVCGAPLLVETVVPREPGQVVAARAAGPETGRPDRCPEPKIPGEAVAGWGDGDADPVAPGGPSVTRRRQGPDAGRAPSVERPGPETLARSNEPLHRPRRSGQAHPSAP